MRHIVMVYHTATGGTAQMIRAAEQGARAAAPGIEVRVVPAEQAVSADVLGADGYVFATPENLAAMAGVMKSFFDRTYYDVLDRVEGRPYLSLICAGSDGRNTARQIERIATGWRLKAIAAACIVHTHAQTAESIRRAKQIGAQDLERCRELGATLAAGLDLGIY